MSVLVLSAVFTYFFMSLDYFYGFEFILRGMKAVKGKTIG